MATIGLFFPILHDRLFILPSLDVEQSLIWEANYLRPDASLFQFLHNTYCVHHLRANSYQCHISITIFNEDTVIAPFVLRLS